MPTITKPIVPDHIVIIQREYLERIYNLSDNPSTTGDSGGGLPPINPRKRGISPQEEYDYSKIPRYQIEFTKGFGKNEDEDLKKVLALITADFLLTPKTESEIYELIIISNNALYDLNKIELKENDGLQRVEEFINKHKNKQVISSLVQAFDLFKNMPEDSNANDKKALFITLETLMQQESKYITNYNKALRFLASSNLVRDEIFLTAKELLFLTLGKEDFAFLKDNLEKSFSKKTPTEILEILNNAYNRYSENRNKEFGLPDYDAGDLRILILRFQTFFQGNEEVLAVIEKTLEIFNSIRNEENNVQDIADVISEALESKEIIFTGYFKEVLAKMEKQLEQQKIQEMRQWLERLVSDNKDRER
jgi:hypothetical protein